MLFLGFGAFEWWFQLVDLEVVSLVFRRKREKMNGGFGLLELDLGF